jgi:hypothetical protein
MARFGHRASVDFRRCAKACPQPSPISAADEHYQSSICAYLRLNHGCRNPRKSAESLGFVVFSRSCDSPNFWLAEAEFVLGSDIEAQPRPCANAGTIGAQFRSFNYRTVSRRRRGSRPCWRSATHHRPGRRAGRRRRTGDRGSAPPRRATESVTPASTKPRSARPAPPVPSGAAPTPANSRVRSR